MAVSIFDGNRIDATRFNSWRKSAVHIWVSLEVTFLIQVLWIATTDMHLLLATVINTVESTVKHLDAPIQSVIWLTRKQWLIDLNEFAACLGKGADMYVEDVSKVTCKLLQNLFAFP